MTRPAPPSSASVFAVLTGDIIQSTRLPAERLSRVRNIVAKTAREFRPGPRQGVCGVPEFFRGDSWQLLLREPRWALRLALLIRAVLSAEVNVETRISIGIGGADVIEEKRISLSTGESFTLSGRALDNMTGYFDLTGALPERTGTLARWFPATLHLCSGLVRPWTRRQAQIVSLALLADNPTHESIAKSLKPNVSKQTVSESLAGAGWRTLLEALRAFEETDWQIVVGPSPGSGTAQ